MVAAIAGDNAARGALGSSQIDIDPHTLDLKPPEQEFCVVEADFSQQCAIAGIAAGQNAVIHGPPGTGKSQTITNLIATLVAEGKTVLFVAEKRAALEVVQQRQEKEWPRPSLHGPAWSRTQPQEGYGITRLTMLGLNSSLDEMALKNPELKAVCGGNPQQLRGGVQEAGRGPSEGRQGPGTQAPRRAHHSGHERPPGARGNHQARSGEEDAVQASPSGLPRGYGGDDRRLPVLDGESSLLPNSSIPLSGLITSSLTSISDSPRRCYPRRDAGKYVIVAGDNKQLPPTGFFAGGVSEDDATVRRWRLKASWT